MVEMRQLQVVVRLLTSLSVRLSGQWGMAAMVVVASVVCYQNVDLIASSLVGTVGKPVNRPGLLQAG